MRDEFLDEDGSAAALAIEDVTERRNVEREKDELLRTKRSCCRKCSTALPTVFRLLASILLLKARTVQSKGIRIHLQDAHQRVMSVASVQQQLQASGLNESIEIGPYLSKLCDSSAKSMIGDRRPLSLSVQATGGAATSSEAVSLGLIVTGLVINALKHAFPSGDTGDIFVGSDARATRWRLSISDNGMASAQVSDQRPHSGLGTSIVQALPHQLGAIVSESGGPEGTAISILAIASADRG